MPTDKTVGFYNVFVCYSNYSIFEMTTINENLGYILAKKDVIELKSIFKKGSLIFLRLSGSARVKYLLVL